MEIRICVQKFETIGFASGTCESHFRKSLHQISTDKICVICGLTAGCLLTGGCMQTEAGAHALLPGTLLPFTFFNLRPDAGERFASELTHLDVQQCRHDRD